MIFANTKDQVDEIEAYLQEKDVRILKNTWWDGATRPL